MRGPRVSNPWLFEKLAYSLNHLPILLMGSVEVSSDYCHGANGKRISAAVSLASCRLFFSFITYTPFPDCRLTAYIIKSPTSILSLMYGCLIHYD